MRPRTCLVRRVVTVGGPMESGMLVRSSDIAHTPRPVASLHALDWLNFFLAALLTGFGPFVSLYLADRGWLPANIGLVFTVSA